MRKHWFIVLVVILIAVGVYYYASPPTDFLTEEILAERLSKDGNFELEPKHILAIYQLDSKHYYVPYKIPENETGISLWVFKNREWHIAFTGGNMDGVVWHLEPNDFSKSYYIWHVIGEGMTELQVTALRQRGVESYNYEEDIPIQRYTPEAIVTQRIAVNGKAYGFESLNEQMQTALNVIPQVSSNQFSLLASDSWHYINVTYYWQLYNSQGEPIEAKRSGDGYGSGGSFDKTNLDFLQPLQNLEPIED